MDDEKLKFLYQYCLQGLPIFPLNWIDPHTGKCSCRKPDCSSPGKHPFLKGGFKNASTNQVRVEGWHKRYPLANWGMRTGSKEIGGSGVLVVDIDRKNHGFNAWEALVGNDKEEETITVRTGRLGRHCWFKYPVGQHIGCSAGALGMGLDIRAEGGYVLVPPSATTNPYKFDLSPFPDLAGLHQPPHGQNHDYNDQNGLILPVPGWLLERLDSLGERAAPPTPGKQDRVLIPVGARHQNLLKFGVSLKNLGFGETDLRQGLYTLRDHWCQAGDHPVPDGEIKSIVGWIMDNTPAHKTTDKGNARRFRDQYGGEVMYDFRSEKWIVWDGCRWNLNFEKGLLDKVHQTLDSIYLEAGRIRDKRKSEVIRKHGEKSEAAQKPDALLKQARHMMSTEGVEFDRYHEFVTVRNGVVDLRTGRLLPHNRQYYFTRMIDIDFNPEAECPHWLEFLEMVTRRDRDLVRHLQKAFGCTLNGYTDEQNLFYVYGDGANGKSTCLKVIMDIVGEYGEKVPIGSLMETFQGGARPKPEITKIKGARMVLTTEMPANRKMNESLVKELTGGDSITARPLYRGDITFKPTHKLWVVGNHKPVIVGTDEGILRRFHMIPFVYKAAAFPPGGEALQTGAGGHPRLDGAGQHILFCWRPGAGRCS